MERKREALEEKYKDSSKDVEMFKHKATAIEKGRMTPLMRRIKMRSR